jgi:hypothetical protein
MMKSRPPRLGSADLGSYSRVLWQLGGYRIAVHEGRIRARDSEFLLYGSRLYAVYETDICTTWDG